MAKAATKRWVMPAWMEPYRKHIKNTGGNSVEELMNDRTCDISNNAVRAALCVAIQSQVALLEHLHRDGLLSSLGGHDRMNDAYVLPASASHGQR